MAARETTSGSKSELAAEIREILQRHDANDDLRLSYAEFMAAASARAGHLAEDVAEEEQEVETEVHAAGGATAQSPRVYKHKSGPMSPHRSEARGGEAVEDRSQELEGENGCTSAEQVCAAAAELVANFRKAENRHRLGRVRWKLLNEAKALLVLSAPFASTGGNGGDYTDRRVETAMREVLALGLL